MATKSVRVTQTKSTYGELKSIISSVKGLGLRRRHHTVELNATPAVMGMVRESGWMLKVEEV